MKQKIAATISLITLALILALSSCAPISEGSVGGKGTTGSGGKNGVPITITLPPLGNASIRALSSEQVSRLQKETASYRVVFSGDGQNVTRSGSSSSFSASFPVGTQVSITVYCLNADDEVIVETVTKTITVSSGTNRLDFKLSEDGNEIIPPPPPSPPAPPPSIKSAVSYELDGGDWSPTSVPPQTEEYDEGATVTITTNVPTKQGFTFLGWKSSVSSLIPSGGGDNFQAGSTFTMPSSAVTFTAQWTSLPTHTVTYDLGFDPSSGSRTSTAQVPEGAAVSLTAPSAERVGYEFKYWMNGQAQAPSGLTMGNSDITLVADWNVIPYTITYNANGGGSNPGNTTFTIEDSYVTFAASGTLAKTGYAFANWETTSGQDVSNITNPADLINLMGGSTTLALTAVWREETYNIEYTVASGEGTGTVSATFTITQNGGQVTLNDGTAVFTRSGYRIASWKYDDNSSAGNAGAQVAASAFIAKADAGGSTSLQLTAVWTPIQYTITYNANGGGNNPASTTFTVADSSVTFASSGALAKTGYTCMGWETTGRIDIANMTRPADLIQLITSGTTLALRAKWEISYKYDKGSWEVGDIVCDNGNALTLANYNAVKTDTELSPAVAVVYKNDSAASKVYIVGKVHEQTGLLEWCLGSANGNNANFASLQCEPDDGTTDGAYTFNGNPPSGAGQNTDGSGNWQKLRQELAGDDDTGTTGNYPAWEWVNDYGTAQSLTGDLATGWYLPTVAELFDIWKANNGSSAIDNALTAVGGSTFSGSTKRFYLSSSQNAYGDSHALDLNFDSGSYGDDSKGASGRSLCAVRQLPYY